MYTVPVFACWKMLIWPVPAEFKNFPVLAEPRTTKFACHDESKTTGLPGVLGSKQIGPTNDSWRAFAVFPVVLVAVNTPSPLQHSPSFVAVADPVAVQSSSLIVRLAVKFELPTTVESSEPVRMKHSQLPSEALQA
jgi:hypothetical protein